MESYLANKMMVRAQVNSVSIGIYCHFRCFRISSYSGKAGRHDTGSERDLTLSQLAANQTEGEHLSCHWMLLFRQLG